MVFGNAFGQDYYEDEVNPSIFYPRRPQRISVHKEVGIFEECTYEWREGDLSILLPNGKKDIFLLGKAFKFPHQQDPCTHWIDATSDKKNSKEYVEGKTKMVVTYWYQKHCMVTKDEKGATVLDTNNCRVEKVTDQVDVAK